MLLGVKYSFKLSEEIPLPRDGYMALHAIMNALDGIICRENLFFYMLHPVGSTAMSFHGCFTGAAYMMDRALKQCLAQVRILSRATLSYHYLVYVKFDSLNAIILMNQLII